MYSRQVANGSEEGIGLSVTNREHTFAEPPQRIDFRLQEGILVTG